MSLETRALERAFRYNSVDLADPGAQYSAEEVRDLYTVTYPELANAAIEGPENKDGKLVYTFRRPVGTKGADASIRTPHGYAVENDQGFFVGIWKSRRIAEDMVRKGQPSHNERVVPLYQQPNPSPTWCSRFVAWIAG